MFVFLHHKVGLQATIALQITTTPRPGNNHNSINLIPFHLESIPAKTSFMSAKIFDIATHSAHKLHLAIQIHPKKHPFLTDRKEKFHSVRHFGLFVPRPPRLQRCGGWSRFLGLSTNRATQKLFLFHFSRRGNVMVVFP